MLPKLKTQLSEIKGVFRGKERKALNEQIKQTEQEISERLDKLPDTLKEDGYPDVQAFMATYREAEAVVEQYIAVLPNGNGRLRKSADCKKRPKGRASETGSDSCRSRADSSHAERNPLTETADRHRKTAAMVLPIIGGLHSLISVPAFE